MQSNNGQDLDIRGLVKSFNGLKAVDRVSFQIPSGTVFGLLGPNGAGKTTIIRIIMGILGADEGDVYYGSFPITRLASCRIGYLPEERGLYQKTRLRETLVYLARLKGLTGAEAGKYIDLYLEQFQLQDYAHKNIQVLSKGNQQKAQFIAAIMHQPSVVILDEPFMGFDPLNLRLIKDVIRDLQTAGVTVLLSTHQMEQVEQLCQTICLINQGKVVLKGPLAEIKSSHREKSVEVSFEGSVPRGIDQWLAVHKSGESAVVGHLQQGLAPTLQGLMELGRVLEFKVREPTLEEIFISAVRGPEA